MGQYTRPQATTRDLNCVRAPSCAVSPCSIRVLRALAMARRLAVPYAVTICVIGERGLGSVNNAYSSIKRTMFVDVPAPTGFEVRAENLCPLNGEKMIGSIRPTSPHGVSSLEAHPQGDSVGRCSHRRRSVQAAAFLDAVNDLMYSVPCLTLSLKACLPLAGSKLLSVPPDSK